MDFIIYPKSNKYLDPSYEVIENLSHKLLIKSKNKYFYNNKGKDFAIIGDFIVESSFQPHLIFNKDYQRIIEEIKGTYYLFIISEEAIKCYSSFLGVLPVYYSEEQGIVSNILKNITNLTQNYSVDNQFILESYLFNHSFKDRTLFKNIRLLETHNAIHIKKDNKLSFSKEFNVNELIIDQPQTGFKAYSFLVKKFINTVDKYVPQEKSIISFTGGFDGRTIVSVASHLGKNFTTASFGKIENDDVSIPLTHSKELNIKFDFIDLAKSEYLNDEQYLAFSEMLEHTPGFNVALYSQFTYFAKRVSSFSDYLITGYAGSELMRATHIIGAITPQALYDIITIEDRDILKDKLLSNNTLKLLKKEIVNENIDNLIDDIMSQKKDWAALDTNNKKLYNYLLNHSIRKIFGTWQVSQSKHLNVRSPFIDFSFVKALFKTDLAGVYNDFYTENPIKRFKGQMLYALIIKATNEKMLHLKTGKGYPPSYLLSFKGKVKMVAPFILKRINRKVGKSSINNLSLIDFLRKVELINLDENIFEKKQIENQMNVISDDMNERTRDALLNTYSISYFINGIKHQ